MNKILFITTNIILVLVSNVVLLMIVTVFQRARSAAAKSALLVAGGVTPGIYLPPRVALIQKQTREAAKAFGLKLLHPKPAKNFNNTPNIRLNMVGGNHLQHQMFFSSISIIEGVGVNNLWSQIVNSPRMIVGNALSTIQIRNASTTQNPVYYGLDIFALASASFIRSNYASIFPIYFVPQSAGTQIFVFLLLLLSLRTKVAMEAYVYPKEGSDINFITRIPEEKLIRSVRDDPFVYPNKGRYQILITKIPEDLDNARIFRGVRYVLLSNPISACPDCSLKQSLPNKNMSSSLFVNRNISRKPMNNSALFFSRSIANKLLSQITLLRVSSVIIRQASTTPFEYDYDSLHQAVSELKDSKMKVSQRVRPHFSSKAESLPSRLVKNFVPLDSISAPTGYELLCPKSASYYHIDRPLDITEKSLRNSLKDFILCLEDDKTYIVHLIAHYTPKEIGFRTVMKSFFLSNRVPLKSLQDVIVKSLTSQLEYYQAEELIRLTIRVKESYMMKERGAIGHLLELSDNIIRRYGYDWATRLKDPSLYPLKELLTLEELIRQASETKSSVEQYAILKSMRKIKQELELLFNPEQKSQVEILLDEVGPITSRTDDRVLLVVKELQEELTQTRKESNEMMLLLKSNIARLDAQLTKKDKELAQKDKELAQKEKELAQKEAHNKSVQSETISMLMSSSRLKGKPPLTDRDREMVEYGQKSVQDRLDYELELKLKHELEMKRIDAETALKMRAYDAQESEAEIIKKLSPELLSKIVSSEPAKAVSEATENRELRGPQITSATDSASAPPSSESTASESSKVDKELLELKRLEVERLRLELELARERRLASERSIKFEGSHRLSPDTELMLFDIGKVGKRNYATSTSFVNAWEPFIFDKYAPGTFEFKWGKNYLVFILASSKWLVLDSTRLPVLTFKDYPDRRIINEMYRLYFNDLSLVKHFSPLPTFKCTKSHSAPANDSFGVWDTESYHSINGTVDTLGLQTLAFKFPGNDARTFYISDYESVDLMASAFWQTLAAESNGRVLYAHNASFDYSFTLDSLQKTFGKDNIVILRHKNKIKAVEVILEGKCVIKLHDSAALFYQAGLRDLCATYSVSNPKTYFPYNFATLETFNYIGPIPPYELWSNNHNPENNCPFEVWDKLPKDNWNLREELVNYMVQDLIALEQVLTKHAQYIWENFGLNLHEVLTAPGMSKYLMFQEQFYYKETNYKEVRRKNQVILQNGKVGTPGPLSRIVKFPGNHECETFIRESYRGGINEVFETEMMKGLSHDANSMYPFGMKGPMPIGQPVMTRDVDLFSMYANKWVYFVKCKVHVPEQMYPPLYVLNEGILTSPVGDFVGTWYSPELVNAVTNYGVKIKEIIMGVRFERCDDLFNKFIDTVYKIKCQQDEYKRERDPRYSPALRDLTKLILNSGYGGFGMHDLVSMTRIVSPEEAERISELFPIEVLKEFKDGNILIGYKQVPNPDILSKIDVSSLSKEELKILKDGIYGRTKVNIAIASAVTSNARVNLLNTGLAIRQNGGKVYKCATDSWYHEGDMPSHLVDTQGVLGLWKKEHDINYGIFTGGNIYMLNPGEGKKEVRKIGSLHKDFKGDVTLSDLQNMLLGQPLEKRTVHWSRPLFGPAESAVTIRESTIRLLPAVKKRVPIYENGKWIGGAPIKLNGTERVDYDYMAVWNNRYGPQPTGLAHIPLVPPPHNHGPPSSLVYL